MSRVLVNLSLVTFLSYVHITNQEHVIPLLDEKPAPEFIRNTSYGLLLLLWCFHSGSLYCAVLFQCILAIPILPLLTHASERGLWGMGGIVGGDIVIVLWCLVGKWMRGIASCRDCYRNNQDNGTCKCTLIDPYMTALPLVAPDGDASGADLTAQLAKQLHKLSMHFSVNYAFRIIILRIFRTKSSTFSLTHFYVCKFININSLF